MEKDKELEVISDHEVEINYDDLLSILLTNLKKIRKNEYLSQIEMSNIIKTLQGNYSMMENGIRDIRPLSLYYLVAKL